MSKGLPKVVVKYKALGNSTLIGNVYWCTAEVELKCSSCGSIQVLTLAYDPPFNLVRVEAVCVLCGKPVVLFGEENE